MEWGDKLPILQKMQEKTGKAPQSLLDKPDVPWYYEVFIRHFFTLSFSRTRNSNGYNPIDIPSILQYNLEVTKLNPSDFIFIIQSLDEAYLKKHYEKVEAQRKNASKSAKTPRGKR